MKCKSFRVVYRKQRIASQCTLLQQTVFVILTRLDFYLTPIQCKYSEVVMTLPSTNEKEFYQLENLETVLS